MLTKKWFLFGARYLSKLVYIGVKGALRKILGSVDQKWISEKVLKGLKYLWVGRGSAPPPPKSAPALVYRLQNLPNRIKINIDIGWSSGESKVFWKYISLCKNQGDYVSKLKKDKLSNKKDTNNLRSLFCYDYSADLS